MSAIYENRDLVVPGDVLYEGKIRTGENTFRQEGKVIANRIGLVNYNRGMVSVIALEAGFHPLQGDLVIGDIVDIELGKWVVDIDTEPSGILHVQDAIDSPYRSDIVLPRILDVGDSIIAKIVDMDRRKTPILSILGRGLGKIRSGFIIRLTPSKIPRLIGKKGSMVNMILRETGCNIVIGQNGRILIDGRTREQETLAVDVIQKIEREAHISGLTNRVQDYLKIIKEKK
jgi:exosome complex component RRP4